MIQEELGIVCGFLSSSLDKPDDIVRVNFDKLMQVPMRYSDAKKCTDAPPGTKFKISYVVIEAKKQ